MPDAQNKPAELSFRLQAPNDMVAGVQHELFLSPAWIFASGVHDDPSLWQGDYLPSCEMAWINANGENVRFEGPALLCSHGCDTEPERDEFATIAPAFNLDDYVRRLAQIEGAEDKGDAWLLQRRTTIRRQRIAKLFYMPAVNTHPERVVDFSMASPIHTKRLAKVLRDFIDAERLRFTERGYFLFVAKLAHHLAHAERIQDYRRP